MPELDFEYECPQCNHKHKFRENGQKIITVGSPVYFIPMMMYPPRICEKCGEIMRRVAN